MAEDLDLHLLRRSVGDTTDVGHGLVVARSGAIVRKLGGRAPVNHSVLSKGENGSEENDYGEESRHEAIVRKRSYGLVTRNAELLSKQTRDPEAARALFRLRKCRDYLVAVAAIFLTMASTSLRSLSFSPEE